MLRFNGATGLILISVAGTRGHAQSTATSPYSGLGHVVETTAFGRNIQHLSINHTASGWFAEYLRKDHGSLRSSFPRVVCIYLCMDEADCDASRTRWCLAPSTRKLFLGRHRGPGGLPLFRQILCWPDASDAGRWAEGCDLLDTSTSSGPGSSSRGWIDTVRRDEYRARSLVRFMDQVNRPSDDKLCTQGGGSSTVSSDGVAEWVDGQGPGEDKVSTWDGILCLCDRTGRPSCQPPAGMSIANRTPPQAHSLPNLVRIRGDPWRVQVESLGVS